MQRHDSCHYILSTILGTVANIASKATLDAVPMIPKLLAASQGALPNIYTSTKGVLFDIPLFYFTASCCTLMASINTQVHEEYVDYLLVLLYPTRTSW